MSSTRPLAKTGSDMERLLLAAGANERPDAPSVRRAASVLGLVPRAALVAATLGVAVRATRWTSFAAWGSLSIAGIAGIALATHAGRPVPAAGVPVVAAPAWRPSAASAEAVSPPPPTLAEAPLAARLLDGHPLPHRAGPASFAQADRLREQAEALDRVRALLAAGDSTEALARLGDFDRRYAGGSLREEALLLRVEALAHGGIEARRRASPDAF